MSANRTDAETIARLEIGLRRMPKLRRKIFLAIRLDDLSYAEIAERTGLSVERVERHFARSLITLLEAVGDYPPLPRWKHLLRWVAARLWR